MIFSTQLMHNLQIQVGELYRLKIGGGGTPFPRVPPYFDHWQKATRTILIIQQQQLLFRVHVKTASTERRFQQFRSHVLYGNVGFKFA